MKFCAGDFRSTRLTVVYVRTKEGTRLLLDVAYRLSTYIDDKLCLWFLLIKVQ